MDEVDRLIDDAMRFEENEDYLSAYDKWEELALEYNNPLGWEMLGDHLYSGKSYKSKGAALFCRLKAIRANCDDEVVDDLIYIFDNSSTHVIDDRSLILEQLRKIKWRMCNPDVKGYEKKLNLLVDALEEMIYGNTKPKDFEEFKII